MLNETLLGEFGEVLFHIATVKDAINLKDIKGNACVLSRWFILECSNSEWHPNFCLLVFIINKTLFWTLVVWFTFINPKLSDKYWIIWNELLFYRIVLKVLLILNEIAFLFLCSIMDHMWYWLKSVTLLFHDTTGQEQIQL